MYLSLILCFQLFTLMVSVIISLILRAKFDIVEPEVVLIGALYSTFSILIFGIFVRALTLPGTFRLLKIVLSLSLKILMLMVLMKMFSEHEKGFILNFLAGVMTFLPSSLLYSIFLSRLKDLNKQSSPKV